MVSRHATEQFERRELFSDARRRYLELGDAGSAARMLLYEARAALEASEGSLAAGRVLEATGVFRGLDEAWSQVECLELGSTVLSEFGEDEATAVAAGAAQAAHRRLGTPPTFAASIMRRDMHPIASRLCMIRS